MPGAPHGCRQRTQGAGEVDALVAQQREQVIDECVGLGVGTREAEVGAHPRAPVRVVAGRERPDELGGRADRRVLILVEKRQQCLGKAGQVPAGDRRLVAVRVAAAVVDRAEHGVGINASRNAHGP